MHIVIPGALPPSVFAGELAKLLPQRAPVLHGWLQAASAVQTAFDPRRHGCTPFEAWQLEQAGYQTQPGLPLGAGLGPLLAASAADDPQAVWLVELAHLALGADQANLLAPDLMDLHADESRLLLETARPCMDEAGFHAEALTPQRWRLTLPAGLTPAATASPTAVAGRRLDAWWTQDAATRPWRRLLNEIQMAWHEHPVNEVRAARGAPPVNALWLYGGARGWTRPAAANPAPLVLTQLDAAHRHGDWSGWLDALSALDSQHLQALAGKSGLPDQTVQLLLLGSERRVALTLKPRGSLLGWLPASKKNWSAWWSHPV